MNVSREWLGDWLPDGLPGDEAVVEAMTMAGYPIEDLRQTDGDTVYDVEVTSNRPDLLCHEGVARELAALLGLPFRELTFGLHETDEPADGVAAVRVETDRCPHFTLRVLRGVKVGPSPEPIARRLAAVGQRPINNAVDATNYAMLALGQPTHAFDLHKVRGPLVVRPAADGETLTTLDGQTRTLLAGQTVIADDAGPISLAGIMGGATTEVTGDTTDVLLEAARWDPLDVRTTARHFALGSEAAYRYERGVPPIATMRTGDYIAHLLQTHAGAAVLRGRTEAGSGAYDPPAVTLRPGQLRRRLGVDIPVEEQIDMLRRLHLAPEVADDGTITCRAPAHRPDVRIEVDLIEEVIRGLGYGRVPTEETIRIRVAKPDPQRAAQRLVRRHLAACGWYEAVTFSFAGDRLADAFLPDGATLQRADPRVRKADAALRPSVLPGLIESVARNEAVGNAGARLFEVGAAFWYDAGGEPREEVRLALAGGDYPRLRGALESLLERLDPSRAVEVRPAAAPGFGGRAAGEVVWGDRVVGRIGMLARPVADAAGLRAPVAAAELPLGPLLDGRIEAPAVRPPGRFPAVVRDLSLVVEERVPFAELARAVRAADPADLTHVGHVTTFRGRQVGPGRKSVTLQLTFNRPDRTLLGEDVDAAVARVRAAAGAAVGAEVRG